MIPQDKLAEFDGMWCLVNLPKGVQTEKDIQAVRGYLCELVETGSSPGILSVFMAAMKVFVDEWSKDD
jgi:hypothetical protein